MASFELRERLIKIDDLEIEVFKVDIRREYRNELTFQIRDQLEHANILWNLYINRAKIDFEYDYDKYADFTYKAWIVRFEPDMESDEKDMLLLKIEITEFRKREKANEVIKEG